MQRSAASTRKLGQVVGETRKLDAVLCGRRRRRLLSGRESRWRGLTSGRVLLLLELDFVRREPRLLGRLIRRDARLLGRLDVGLRMDARRSTLVGGRVTTSSDLVLRRRRYCSRDSGLLALRAEELARQSFTAFTRHVTPHKVWVGVGRAPLEVEPHAATVDNRDVNGESDGDDEEQRNQANEARIVVVVVLDQRLLLRWRAWRRRRA
mmetsp:Transcript_30469/g.64119  ORF Transcript_30469/g.64119 Transcript_30469/m.64119 type:complete len:208 (+) Transcript_30469:686-1309(+)